MAYALNDIIKNLERQRRAIEQRLTALRDVGGIDAGSSRQQRRKLHGRAE